MAKDMENLVKNFIFSGIDFGGDVALTISTLNAVRALVGVSGSDNLEHALDIAIKKLKDCPEGVLYGNALEKISMLHGDYLNGLVPQRLEAFYRDICDIVNQANGQEFASIILDNLTERGSLSPSKLSDLLMLSKITPKKGETIVCLFDNSINTALQLAKNNDVTFCAQITSTVTLIELLAISLGLKINTIVSDPFGREDGEITGELKSKKFDHIISYPPFGMRKNVTMPNGERLTVNSEVLQFEAFKNNWTKSFVTLVPEGALFRASNYELRVRKTILYNGLAEVISLPNGIISNSGISTSIVKLTSEAVSEIQFVDGRTINSATSRATASELSKHIASLLEDKDSVKQRTAQVNRETIEANQLNMTVDRYVISNDMKKIDEILQSSEVIALGDIADILRPQAAKPCRDDEENIEIFKVREIATGDVENSEVLLPARTMTYYQMDFEKVKNSMVRDGDIIVSTKGKVGVIGLIIGESINDEEPWIISQSFAIVRLKKLSPIKDPRILVSLLTASWSLEKLNSYAGGTTVQMIPLIDLKNFKLPLASMEVQAKASSKLDEISKMSREIAQLREKIKAQRAILQSELWGF